MSIITYPLNGITYDADDVQTYLCTRTSGVYASEDCFDISITDDMEVTIGTGLAWIKNADFAGKSICMDESAALTISLGAGSYERIDRIVLKFDKDANETTLEVLEGTPSSSPSGEDIEQDESIYELCLYEISIPAGTTELSASMITDTRTDEDLCGLMRDGVTTIPTATLQAAASELINQLKADIDDVEAGSAYMLSTVYDAKGGAKQVAFEDDLPFPLAISDDGEYGYNDTDGEFHPITTYEAGTDVGTAEIDTDTSVSSSNTMATNCIVEPVVVESGCIKACGMMIQEGKIYLGTLASKAGSYTGAYTYYCNDVSYTFDEPFGAPPAVVVSIGSAANYSTSEHVYSTTTTGFSIKVLCDENMGTNTYTLSWIAIGPAPTEDE